MHTYISPEKSAKFYGLLNLFLLTFHCKISVSHAADFQLKTILVLGGNGFLGSHTVNALLDQGGFNITLLNRGNVYFNSDKEIDPYVNQIIQCDRKTLLRATCKKLLEKTWYDAVIDFSSYEDKQIEQVIDILRNRVGLYIFISTDAVYDISEKKHEGKTREEDTTEIIDEKKKEKVQKASLYGKRKKGCEERLIVQREKFGFPYLILRLPDAIGK